MKLTPKLFVAFIICLGVVLGIAYAQTKAPAPPAPAVQASPQGRYQIVFSQHVRADTFLLDTQTGKVWTHTSYPFLEGDPDAWAVQPRLDNDEQERLWIGTQTRKKQP